MGRGDKRTKKGKIAAGSYGNSRPHKLTKNTASVKKTKATKKPKAKKTKK